MLLCVCQCGCIVEFKRHVLVTELPVFTLPIFFYFSFLSCLLFRSPRFALGLYVVFSRLVKLASVNLAHSLSLVVVFIFHSTSGGAIFKKGKHFTVSNPANSEHGFLFLAPKASIRDTLAYDLCWNKLCTNRQNLCKGNFLL